MKVFVRLIWVFSVVSTLSFAKINQSTVPLVAVSIKPIHSLVDFLMQGMKRRPILIFTGKTSPHVANVPPSMLQKIKRAKLLIWLGKEYSTGLAKIAKTRTREENILTILHSKVPLNLYAPRKGDLWAGCGGSKHKHHTHHNCHSGKSDPHVWLDPRNAKAIATVICKRLKMLDPENKHYYEENKVKLIKKIDELTMTLTKRIKPHKGQSYIIYHDSTQYFDNYFGIKAVGSVVLEPGVPVSAGHIKRLRDYLSSNSNVPVFVELPYSIENIRKYFSFPGIKTGSMDPVKFGVLDPVGLSVAPGPYAYFDIMHHLVDNFIVQLERAA